MLGELVRKSYYDTCKGHEGLTPLIHVHCLASFGADLMDRLEMGPEPGPERDREIVRLVNDLMQAYQRRVAFIQTLDEFEQAIK
jgi:hypothetical protein